MLCPRCNVELKLGIAIDPRTDKNTLFYRQQYPLTADELELINVLKCPKCGYSDDGIKE